MAYVDKETGQVKRLEGNPSRHPAAAGATAPKGPATINQVNDPERILYPLKRAGRAATANGSARAGMRRWIPLRRNSRGPRRRSPRRGDVSCGPAGRGRLHGARAAGAGVSMGTIAHQHLLLSRADRLRLLDGDRSALARPRQRSLHPARSVPTWRAGHYFNPHAQRIIEAKMNGARLAVMDPRLSNTASHGRLLAADLARLRGGSSAGDGDV